MVMGVWVVRSPAANNVDEKVRMHIRVVVGMLAGLVMHTTSWIYCVTEYGAA